MTESHRSASLRRTKQNFADFEGNFMFVRNKETSRGRNNQLEPKVNSIKINRSKLPADFFSKADSLKQKSSLVRPSLNEDKRLHRGLTKKSQSDRKDLSPEKTSFFGFFSQNVIPIKYQGNSLNLKRKFQSREEPKRDKIVPEGRKFTPMSGIHRADLLNMFPSTQDPHFIQSIASSARNRGFPFTVRTKDSGTKNSSRNNILKESSTLQVRNQPNSIEEDLRNITFFNSKSNCLPPINQNKS